jgi:hypothetical protein
VTAAAILVLIQILGAVAGADWAFLQICEVIKKDGGIEATGQNLLEILRGQATPPTLSQLNVSNPELHARAVQLLGSQGSPA